tara:strand:+ start:269 stop:1012 length:744 start_codon:yes stop_codon:yes gene_type:complete
MSDFKIELKNLNKFFNNNKVLSDINLNIFTGEIFGILGKSGAGKSTLLRCINLLERPSSGEVLINSNIKSDITSLNKLDLLQIRRQIGFIFQHFNLLESKSAFDNIALPLKFLGVSKSEIAERVSKLLGLVDLEDKRDYFPSQLSGGQKQRVAIARALVSNSSILLCDEATSALDTESTYNILELLKKINKEYGVTIVLITHELDVVKKICNRTAVLHNGSLVEVSQTHQLFSNPQHKVTKQLLNDY